jgi:hypothetical protein
MNRIQSAWRRAAACVLVLALVGGTVQAQDDEDDKWYLTAELSTVSASGNTESMTYGLGSTIGFLFPHSEIKIEGGGVLSESNLGLDYVSQADTTDLLKRDSLVRTAEAYYARGRYDFKFAKYFLALVGVDWLRNTFAGIDSRTLIGVGLGNTWKDSEKTKFRTNYSGTYTFQRDVVEDPFNKTEFPGIRLSYELWAQLTGAAEFESELRFDFNLDNSDDLRANWYNALPVSISSVLAFKPALAFLWRNQPSFATVPVLDATGTEVGTANVRLRKLDTFFTMALVVKI